jgi:predicted nucleotidyltransferase
VVDGPLDDPLVRERALQRLRDCGYLDIHDGAEVNETNRAEEAVARLMSDRRDA